VPLALHGPEIALRLALTVVAGALFGLDRSERGHVAGLRTTVLVCLAASVSMLQANLLLITAGKTASDFSVLDLMRLPLGILTGMGFIGAGAIIRRGNSVDGVTTAAVLWLTTVVGLCLGGGQLVLGSAVTAIALTLLPGLAILERALHQERRGQLAVKVTEGGPSESVVKTLLLENGYMLVRWDVAYLAEGAGKLCTMTCEVRWRNRQGYTGPPTFLRDLADRPGVAMVAWTT
jgi:putative Mg2+ transporter-C (MgtC) family protein